MFLSDNIGEYELTVQQSLDYLIARALDSGYTPESIKSFKEELDELFEILF